MKGIVRNILVITTGRDCDQFIRLLNIGWPLAPVLSANDANALLSSAV